MKLAKLLSTPLMLLLSLQTVAGSTMKAFEDTENKLKFDYPVTFTLLDQPEPCWPPDMKKPVSGTICTRVWHLTGKDFDEALKRFIKGALTAAGAEGELISKTPLKTKLSPGAWLVKARRKGTGSSSNIDKREVAFVIVQLPQRTEEKKTLQSVNGIARMRWQIRLIYADPESALETIGASLKPMT